MALLRTFGDLEARSIDDHTDIARFMESLGRGRATLWEDILQSPRILLISEAGTGKTHECKQQVERLKEAGESAFFLELSQLASSPDLNSLLSIEDEAALAQWLSSQSDIATFFLDSVDELKLTLNTFELALTRFKKGIRGQLARARIVVTTRPIPFDGELVRTHLPVPPKPTVADTMSKEELFASVAMGELEKDPESPPANEPPTFRTVGLMPLSDSQVIELARDQGVANPEEFFADPEAQETLSFARRPQDIIELCAEWRQNRRIGTHREQVEANVRIKLQPRTDRKEAAALSPNRAFEGASRLALAMIQTRTLTIRHNAASDKVDNTAALNPGRILTDWDQAEVVALLERPLFNFASYGRVRFHHQSALHFLASQRLRSKLQNGLPFKHLRNLLFAETRGSFIVRPSLRAVAAWLAITEQGVFELLRDNEPTVLFDEGDPRSLSQDQRDQALKAYVARFGKGGWRGLSVSMPQLNRFATPALAKTINSEWSAGIENREVRATILHLVISGKLHSCSDILADIALNSTENFERILALRGMDAVDHYQMEAMIASIAEDPDRWDPDISLGAVSALFPHRMPVSVLCAVLARIPRTEQMVSELKWRVTSLVTQSTIAVTDMEELRDGLVALILNKLRWEEDRYPHLISDYSHLTEILAALCLKVIGNNLSDLWLRACYVSARIEDRRVGLEHPQRDLRKALSTFGSQDTSRLFWIGQNILTSVREFSDPRRVLFEINGHDGAIELRVDRDLEWVKAALTDVTRDLYQRDLMLAAAMRLPPINNIGIAYIEALSPLVADSPELTEKLQQFLTWASEPVLESWKEEDKERRVARDVQRARDKESWVVFWRKITTDSDLAFSEDHVFETAHNLWRLMRRTGSDDRASGWNRAFIEQHFGKPAADRLRLSFKDMWRNYRPTLPCERDDDTRNTYYNTWYLGLSGIFAEAEDPEWVEQLTDEDADLAARYALIHLNSLPTWMESISARHPISVDATIGTELSWQLSRPSREHDVTLLYHLGEGARQTARILLPRMLEWIADQGNGSTTDARTLHHLERVLDIILKHGEPEELETIKRLCCERLASGLQLSVATPWIRTLMRLDPELGVTTLESLLSTIPPQPFGPSVSLFDSLFGDRGRELNPKNLAISPQTILRLIRLAYHHVRPEDDQHHEGAYSPDFRDDAQRARESILGALIEARGTGAWAAKLELANDPISFDYRDRFLALAEEAWANEVDGVGFTEAQALAFDQRSEAPPMTDEGMFLVMMDRIDDIHDLLLRDISPREHWADIKKEHVMRREIARVLVNSERDIYRVNQEAVTADEKETDIRLKSTASEHQAVIELKLGENGYSGKVLRDTIKDQLVDCH